MDVNGFVKPCPWAIGYYGHIADGFASVWNNNRVRVLRQCIAHNQLDPICAGASCPYVRSAAANQRTDRLKPYSANAYAFDGAFYLRRYKDLRQATKDGRLNSPHVHYLQYGKYEGRKARYTQYKITRKWISRFDQAYYEHLYTDVARAVANREFSCALEHFLMHGRFEQRQFRLSKHADNNCNYTRAMLDFMAGRNTTEAKPTILSIEATSTCNLACVMCPHAKQLVAEPKHQPVHTFERLLPAIGTQTRLQICGIGEPLLSPFFWRVVEFYNTPVGPHIRMNSNGTLWQEANRRRILLSNVGEVSFSLDAATAETHRKIRGSNFTLVLRNIKQLIAERNALHRATPIVYLNMTLMKENIHELGPFVALAKKLRVDRTRIWHLDNYVQHMEDWTVQRNGWTFDYAKQMLSNYPELSNRLIRQAVKKAETAGVPLQFISDRSVFF